LIDCKKYLENDFKENSIDERITWVLHCSIKPKNQVKSNVR
jgi:hypothetical protein